MAINKEELRDGLKLIAQLRKSAESEKKKIFEDVCNIQETHHRLNLRRRTLVEFERLMLNKCDELFNLVYSELYDGEYNEDGPHY